MKQFYSLLLFFLFSTSSFVLFSQKEKEISVKVNNEKLYGTFLGVKDKNAPIVIIIAGSGATDRDGNSFLIRPNSYQLLAKGLAENGISSLRYDKLGIGKSVTKTKEKDMVFQDNVNQVTAWIDYFQKKKGNNPLILIGHSEGSLIGMLAAQEREISKFISLAGTGRTIDEVVTEQMGNQAPEFQEETSRILAELKKGEKVKDFPAELTALFREDIQPYLISWIKINPQEEIAKLTIPVMIINGSTDIQVALIDGELQKKGNPKAEYIVIDGMNHILKEAPLEKNENMASYYNPKLPIHKELIDKIVAFIKD